MDTFQRLRSYLKQSAMALTREGLQHSRRTTSTGTPYAWSGAVLFYGGILASLKNI